MGPSAAEKPCGSPCPTLPHLGPFICMVGSLTLSLLSSWPSDSLKPLAQAPELPVLGQLSVSFMKALKASLGLGPKSGFWEWDSAVVPMTWSGEGPFGEVADLKEEGWSLQRDLGQAFPTAVLVGHRCRGGRPGGNPLALGEGPVEEALVCRPGLIAEPGPSRTVDRESWRV